MLKYSEVDVVFREIPNEVTLAINITNCPHRCKGCHSTHLRRDIGLPLTKENLQALIDKNEGITCVCFMGGDSDHSYLNELAKFVKESNLLVGVYSGDENFPLDLDLKLFDFIKYGPYIEELGSLENPKTNQKLFQILNNGETIIDITKLLQ